MRGFNKGTPLPQPLAATTEINNYFSALFKTVLMKDSDLPYQSKPPYVLMLFGIAGSLFFGYWAQALYQSININKSANSGAAETIIYVMMAAFIFFALGSFWLAIGMQQYMITESELIIKRPLFFGGRRISIADIEKIEESDDDIKTMNHGLTGETVWYGRKAILKLKNGKKIKISSIEVGGYNILVTKLKKQWIKVVAETLRHPAK